VSCENLSGSVTTNNRNFDSTEQQFTSHSMNVQFNLPTHKVISEPAHLYQVLLLGFEAVGKTALITRNKKQLFYKNYNPSVIEEKFYTRHIVSNQDRREVLSHVQVTDLPGSFWRKKCSSKSLCDRIRTHDGIIVAIDSTKSFDRVKQGLEKLFKIVGNCEQGHSNMRKEDIWHRGRRKCIIISLTKVDLVSEVQVTTEQVQSFFGRCNFNKCHQEEIRSVETSALYGINISTLFQNMAQMCHNSRMEVAGNIYDFWEQPILAECALDIWGIKIKSNENETKMRSNQQWTDSVLLTQKSDQPHYTKRQITRTSPVSAMVSPKILQQSMNKNSNMNCLTIGQALIDSCQVEGMSIPVSKRSRVDGRVITFDNCLPKPVLTRASCSIDGAVIYSLRSSSTVSEDSDFIDNALERSSITEHYRSISSVVSEIEEKDSAKEPESCKEMERRLRSWKEKMMEAKEKNQFAVANMYKQEMIKCHLEIRNKRDRATKLLNRNAFDEDIRSFEQICESNTTGLKGAIFAIDLMNFKLLNDTYGHGAGDSGLREFARALKRIAKKMAKVSGNDWNVYRVGGDEFAMTALVRDKDRDLFRRAAQSLVDVQIPWAKVVDNCKSAGSIFARIGGVFGKYAKYEDADFIERIIKDRNKHIRKNMKQPEKSERVLLYYTDENDRNRVIAHCWKNINVALRMQDFSRCYEIQEYIKFLLDGFLALRNANNSDCNDDSALSKGDVEWLRGNTTCYTTNAFQLLTRRTSLEELYNINGSDVEESSHRKFAHPRLQDKKLSAQNCPFRVIHVNGAQNGYEIIPRGRNVSAPDIEEFFDVPPPDKNYSVKKAHDFQKKRRSKIMSYALEETGTVRKILEYVPRSERKSIKQLTFVEGATVSQLV